MKISELMKKLNKLKKKHGDLPVIIDEVSVNPEADPMFCAMDLTDIGIDKIYEEDSTKRHKAVILVGYNDSVFDFPEKLQ